MARVTVEDCLDNVDNRFELIRKAAERARQLANGAEPMVEAGTDKVTVIALREIAAGHVIGASAKEQLGDVIEDEIVATAVVKDNKEVDAE